MEAEPGTGLASQPWTRPLDARAITGPAEFTYQLTLRPFQEDRDRRAEAGVIECLQVAVG